VEILEISIIQDNNDIHINPKPRCEICGNFRNFRAISEISEQFQKFQSNFKNFREISEISIIQDNNDIHINPKPRCKQGSVHPTDSRTLF
jgi:hypothetical protein